VYEEPGGLAVRVLETLGISGDTVREHVEEAVPAGQYEVGAMHIPFTPRAKKVLELSLREAIELEHNYIGTEHILLALIHDGEGVAARALESIGISLEAALPDEPG
jgi:ATP-dependent Clp protease ATP-binding subunit ClpC